METVNIAISPLVDGDLSSTTIYQQHLAAIMAWRIANAYVLHATVSSPPQKTFHVSLRPRP
jgi:hypothetical protein